MNKKLVRTLITLTCIILLTDLHSAMGGNKTMSKLEGKEVLLIIASNNFRDEEFDVPKKALAKEGANITVASSSLAEATGVLGMRAKANILLDDVNVTDYNAVVFIGGGGAREYYNNSSAHKIAQDAVKQKKILAAICIAPVILANANLLKGKKATVFHSEATALHNKGAIYTAKSIERDGNIITADGPSSAKEFAQMLINALSPE